MTEITGGFARGAYALKSFLKGQYCIFLNVLSVSCHKKEKIGFLRAVSSEFVRDSLSHLRAFVVIKSAM